MLATDDVRFTLASHFNRVRIDESGFAFKCRHPVAMKLVLDHLDLARHNHLGPEGEVGHGNAVLHHVAAPVEGALTKSAQVENSLTQGLTGYRPGVHAHAADRAFSINDCDFLAKLCGANRPLLSCGSATDNDKIEFLVIHIKVLCRWTSHENSRAVREFVNMAAKCLVPHSAEETSRGAQPGSPPRVSQRR